jgi:hypothetical protein
MLPFGSQKPFCMSTTSSAVSRGTTVIWGVNWVS